MGVAGFSHSIARCLHHGMVMTYLMLVATMVSRPAPAGELKGRVHIQSAPGPEKESKKDSPEALDSTTKVDVAANTVGDVVIYVDGATEGNGNHPPPTIAQHNKQFVPRVLPIRAGTTVSFPNLDPFYHNVFSYSKLTRFDLGRYGATGTRSLTFSAAGVVKVFCEIHSQMKGYIVVLKSDAFTVPEADGRYGIHGLAAGRYRVVAWHPSFEPQVREIEIKDGPAVADFDF